MVKKVAFPNMGNYYAVFRFLFAGMGNEIIIPDNNNKKAIEEGAKFSPETICLPFKLNMGNYLSAISKGADTIVMFDSQGQCRFRYYGILQEKILRELGYSVSFINLNSDNFIKEIKKISSISLLKAPRLIYQSYRIIRMIEKIEDRAKWYRAREIKIGETNKLFNKYLNQIEKSDNFSDFKNASQDAEKSFKKIEIKNDEPLKVLLVGEIYCVIDSFANQQIEKKLGDMGVEVHRNVNLSNFIKHGILKHFYKAKTLFKTRRYIKSFVGGHGVHSVSEVIEYTKKGFDGIVHIFPFACMPEITVRPIIQKIGKERGVPILSLSFDEHSSQTGFQTRLEAFVDLIKNKKQKI